MPAIRKGEALAKNISSARSPTQGATIRWFGPAMLCMRYRRQILVKRCWLRDILLPLANREYRAMDLNRSYADHQLALMRAATAPTCGIRAEHRADARRIATLIAQDRAVRSTVGGLTTTDPFLLRRGGLPRTC
ncbi:MAG: hypothetical protein BGP16_03965 [Sphingobium sp. 66-54]|nr:MAG: hypothetical protein BGP16_03965 [Sphingobium sp. 66-54]